MSANESEIGSPASRLREAANQTEIVLEDVWDQDQRQRLSGAKDRLEDVADELEENNV